MNGHASPFVLYPSKHAQHHLTISQSFCVAGGCAQHLVFLQVFKAKWNGVQFVAAKQLRNVGSQRAKLDFLKEVKAFALPPGSPACVHRPAFL